MKSLGHIDVVVKYFYPVAAGIETNIIETYSALVDKGWEVTIHTSRDTLTQKNILSPKDTIRGLKVIRYPYRFWGFWPQIQWGDSHLVCLHNFNIVPHFFIMVYTGIRKILGKKRYGLVVTPHGGFNPEWSIFPQLTGSLKRFYHYTLGTIMINQTVDAVRAVSEWERTEIIKRGVIANKVITISNGIEQEAYLPVDKLVSRQTQIKVKQLGDYMIQIGRIYPIKNYETVIRSLPSLPDKLKYVIVGPVGDEVYCQSLQQLARDLNVSHRVVFWGVIRGVDKYYLIKHARLMVHMAIWESFCNVVHEGLSQGLICIVADNTALPYLISDGKNGFLVPTHDSTALVRKIEYVLGNYRSPVIRAIQKRGTAFGLEESWSKVAAKMHRLYITL